MANKLQMKTKYLLIMVILIIGTVISQMQFDEERVLTEVEEKSLFDIFVEIPEEFLQIETEGTILFNLKLVNLGSAGRIDVFLEYGILDENNNKILSKRETVAVETQANFVRQFDTKGISEGNYGIYVKLIYADGREADSQHSFKIQKKVTTYDLFAWIIIIILVVVLISLLIYKLKPLIEKIKIKFKIKRIVDKKIKPVMKA